MIFPILLGAAAAASFYYAYQSGRANGSSNLTRRASDAIVGDEIMARYGDEVVSIRVTSTTPVSVTGTMFAADGVPTPPQTITVARNDITGITKFQEEPS